MIKPCPIKLYSKKANVGADVVEKLRKVSDSVWVDFEAMVTENIIKENELKIATLTIITTILGCESCDYREDNKRENE